LDGKLMKLPLMMAVDNVTGAECGASGVKINDAAVIKFAPDATSNAPGIKSSTNPLWVTVITLDPEAIGAALVEAHSGSVTI
jgi:hypothetical protein